MSEDPVVPQQFINSHIATLKANVADCFKEHGEQQKRIVTLEATVEHMDAICHTRDSRIKELEGELAELKHKQANIEQAALSWEGVAKELEGELADCRSWLRDAFNEDCSADWYESVEEFLEKHK